MILIPRQRLPAIFASLLVLLAACNPIDQGGEPGTNEPPLVDAGSDQSVVEIDSVTLTGTASDSDGSIALIGWTQSAWDFRVVNNDGAVDFSASKPLYVLDSSV